VWVVKLLFVTVLFVQEVYAGGGVSYFGWVLCSGGHTRCWCLQLASRLTTHSTMYKGLPVVKAPSYVPCGAGYVLLWGQPMLRACTVMMVVRHASSCAGQAEWRLFSATVRLLLSGLHNRGHIT
jgi:hypothetical protein